MKEVIYIDEADRPKQGMPLSFTEFAEKKYIQVSRTKGGNQEWQDDIINEMGNEYHEYLTDFKTDEKPVEFTHCMGDWGWIEITAIRGNLIKIVYLGKCLIDGDMFAAYCQGAIVIYKGHLNSGKF